MCLLQPQPRHQAHCACTRPGRICVVGLGSGLPAAEVDRLTGAGDEAACRVGHEGAGLARLSHGMAVLLGLQNREVMHGFDDAVDFFDEGRADPIASFESPDVVVLRLGVLPEECDGLGLLGHIRLARRDLSLLFVTYLLVHVDLHLQHLHLLVERHGLPAFQVDCVCEVLRLNTHDLLVSVDLVSMTEV